MTKCQLSRQCQHGSGSPTVQELGKVLNNARMPTPNKDNQKNHYEGNEVLE